MSFIRFLYLSLFYKRKGNVFKNLRVCNQSLHIHRAKIQAWRKGKH